MYEESRHHHDEKSRGCNRYHTIATMNDEETPSESAQEIQLSPRTHLHPFQTYLEQQQLSWLTVAQAASVRCLTVWNIAHGTPVGGAQAAYVRVAVHQLSGVAYRGPIVLCEGQAHPSQAADMPTPNGEGLQ